MALAHADGTGRRSYSLSRQIVADRRAYYRTLEEAQAGGVEITGWLTWFVGCVGRAVANARDQVAVSLRRAGVLRRAAEVQLTPRQVKALARMLEGRSRTVPRAA